MKKITRYAFIGLIGMSLMVACKGNNQEATEDTMVEDTMLEVIDTMPVIDEVVEDTVPAEPVKTVAKKTTKKAAEKTTVKLNDKTLNTNTNVNTGKSADAGMKKAATKGSAEKINANTLQTNNNISTGKKAN